MSLVKIRLGISFILFLAQCEAQALRMQITLRRRQGIAPMSGYLGVFAIDINAVCPPEGAVYGQMAKQFAVRSELR